MSNLSNTYVEKVYSEHPLAVWTLDEDLGFLSLIDEQNRSLTDPTKWSVANGTLSEIDVRLSNPPIIDGGSTRILGSVPPSGSITQDVTITSLFSYSRSVFDDLLSNFAFGFYLNVSSVYMTQVKLGYVYDISGGASNQEVLYTGGFTDSTRNQWVYFGNTFDLPPLDATNIRLIIKIVKVEGGGSSADYEALINGISFAQWSETFNQKTVGSLPEPMPIDIALPDSFEVIPAIPYASSGHDGYYLVNDQKLKSINFGIPLAYGSSNVTRIIENKVSTTVYPSLIFPGYGFMNTVGAYNDYTVEMWIRVSSDITDYTKIFGPIASKDGLYIEGPYLTLVYGNNIKSHYVGEWFRPMLIHIKIIRESISLIVNGEEVLSMRIDESKLSLPNELDENGKNQNWLGFYTRSDITSMEIDSFAIYPYAVANEMAKRRWVWGQGTPTLETVNSSLNAITASTDYSVSNYGVNYNYPDFGTWSQGFFSNIAPTSKSILLPDYELPEFILGDKTLNELYDDTYALGPTTDPYITFRPNSSWSTQACRLSFDAFSVLVDPVQSFYGVFETDGLSTKQTLFRIDNLFSGDYVEISVSGTTVSYVSKIDGATTTFYTTTILANQKFVVGLNTPKLSLRTIQGINKFFVNEGSLSLLVGGSLNDTFTGKIYRVGFNNLYGTRKIDSYYASTGEITGATSLSTIDAMMAYVSSYTIKPYQKYETFYVDIACTGYWEDYIPLSYFGKFVSDYEGNQIYDLDYLQVNLDYPENVSLIPGAGSSWTYNDLRARFRFPVQLRYSDLDNSVFTGWANYQEMSEDSAASDIFDTSENQIKSFISFQPITDGANKTILDYNNTELAKGTGVVEPNLLTSAWEETVYEVLDSTIVYPPLKTASDTDVDFNDLALVVHLEIVSDGILRKPVRIRDLQISSNTLEKSSFTPIGSKFAVPVYPYTREGLYYNFSGQNPITIYKESTPYLYTTNNSGWRLRGEFSSKLDRGFSLVLNTEKSLDFELSAFQMWIKYSSPNFPTSAEDPVTIASVTHKGGTYDIYIEDDGSGERGYIYTKNRDTGGIVTNLRYFINGQSVTTPYIIKSSWIVLAISFNSPLSFKQFTGRINFNGPLTYNNISYFLSSSLERSQSTTNRSWARVRTSPLGSTIYWGPNTSGPGGTAAENWLSDDKTWNDVKVLSTTNAFAVNPKNVYDIYLGTNRSIMDDGVNGLEIDYDKAKVYNSLVWSNLTKTAV